MLVVDASIWVSRFLPADETHQESRRWLERYFRSGGQLVEPVLLLVELSAAISRRTGSAELARQTAERVSRVRSIRFVSLDRRLGALATRVAAERRLRGADSIYVATAYRLGLPLVTWDREQLERSAGMVEVSTPVETDPYPNH